MNTRAVAADILEEVLEGEGQSHLLLRHAFAGAPGPGTSGARTLGSGKPEAHTPGSTATPPTAQEKSFLAALVRGTIKALPELDERLSLISSVPVGKMKPYVRTVLRMSLYQLLYMDSVPASAVCNEAVKLVKARGLGGLGGFTNGVLRAAARRKDWPPLSETARRGLPEWLWKRLENDYGPDRTERIAAWWRRPPAIHLRVSRLRRSVTEAAAELERSGYSVQPHPFTPDVLTVSGSALPNLSEGKWFPQDAAAALCVALAPLRPRDRVLDICAAPGGKALQAAEHLLMLRLLRTDAPGTVLACDLSAKKTAYIDEAARRAGLGNLRTQVWDATVYDAAKDAVFDLVIADLPCSGLGVIGRKPEIVWRMNDEKIHELAALQQRILAQALRYVKPGGHLLFSTCTLTREENEGGCAFLEAAGMQPEAFELPEDAPQALKKALATAPRGKLLLLPGEHETDGFFISLWKKPE